MNRPRNRKWKLLPQGMRLRYWGKQLTRYAAEVQDESDQQLPWLQSLVIELTENEQYCYQILKFLDVLPVLDSDEAICQHLLEYFEGLPMPLPGMEHLQAEWALSELSHRSIASEAREMLSSLAKYFMASNVFEALQLQKKHRSEGKGSCFSLTAQAAISEAQADLNVERYTALIQKIPPDVQSWVKQAQNGTDLPGQMTRGSVAIKLSLLIPGLDILNPQKSIDRILQRLLPLMHTARDCNVFILLEMESPEYKFIVLEIFRTLLMHPQLCDWSHIGIELQAAMQETEYDIAALVKLAEIRQVSFGIFLARGYRKPEEDRHAMLYGWQPSSYPTEKAIDDSFSRCVNQLFHHNTLFYTGIFAHSHEVLTSTLMAAEKHNLANDRFSICMHHGISPELQHALVRLSANVQVYFNVGSLGNSGDYLVQRLLQMMDGASVHSQKLAEEGMQPVSSEPDTTLLVMPQGTLSPDKLEIPHRFLEQQERDTFLGEIDRVRRQFNQEYEAIVNGQRRRASEFFNSVNPAYPSEIIGKVVATNLIQADYALDCAWRVFTTWSSIKIQMRAEILRRTAQLMRECRGTLAAWEVFEAGKSWLDADADVCQAIDILNTQAVQAENFYLKFNSASDGEVKHYNYQPLGVGVALTSWRSPLADLVNILATALVSGNCLLLKPSSKTPVIASRFMSLLKAAGLPPGVVQFLPGKGDTLGEHLVAHPQITFVAFSGSLAVNNRVEQLADGIQPGQLAHKRVIADTGSKASVIVDSDADFNLAVASVAKAAFHFQGQKYSNCGRVIVVGRRYQEFIKQLVEVVECQPIGEPKNADNHMGPVINFEAVSLLQQILATAKKYAKLEFAMQYRGDIQGCYVGPVIFSHIDPDCIIPWEQIPGPVLAVMPANTFDEALEIANQVVDAETGSVYSRSPLNISKAKKYFRVESLFVNHVVDEKVMASRFQGAGGIKPGSLDHLLQFMQAQEISESIIDHVVD